MERMLTCNSYIIILVLLFCWTQVGYGQDKRRVYASREETNIGLLTSVTNAGRAVDGNPKTYSTINRLLGVGNLITVTQFLKFSSIQAAGTPVTIKLNFPSSILSVVGGIEIQPFTNLRNVLLSGWQADPAGKAYSANELLGLLNGAGDMEVLFTPQNSNGSSVSYDGIWVRLQGIAVGQSLDLFHAFIIEQGTVTCNDRDKSIDVLSGIRAGTALGGIANATGSVSTPWAIIDGTGSTTLNVGAQILSEVFHTTIFNTPSRPNQIAKVVLQNPGGGLLDLNLLTGLQIQPYLRNIPVGTSLNSSQILSLRLLPASGGKYELTVPVIGSFDRIEVKMGGVVGALGALTIYEVSRTFGAFLHPEAVLRKKMTKCELVDLKDAILNYQPADYTYYYYTVGTGGTPLNSSIATVSGTYYIEARDNTSGCISKRVEVVATVLPLPGKPHLTITNVIN